jgi:hypothetical protein
VRADAQGKQERFPLESSERRGARFTIDLQEGPLQSVAALAEDVRHFRSHLRSVALDRDGHRVLGCIDDLEARLIALDGELRELLRAHLLP